MPQTPKTQPQPQAQPKVYRMNGHEFRFPADTTDMEAMEYVDKWDKDPDNPNGSHYTNKNTIMAGSGPGIGNERTRPKTFMGQAGENLSNLASFMGHGLKRTSQAIVQGPAAAINDEALDALTEANAGHPRQTLGDMGNVLLNELHGVPQKGESVTDPHFMTNTGDTIRPPLLSRGAMAMDTLMGGNPQGMREHDTHGETGAGLADLLAVPGAIRAPELLPPLGRVASSVGSGIRTGANTIKPSTIAQGLRAVANPKKFVLNKLADAMDKPEWNTKPDPNLLSGHDISMGGEGEILPDINHPEGTGIWGGTAPKLGSTYSRPPLWESAGTTPTKPPDQILPEPPPNTNILQGAIRGTTGLSDEVEQYLLSKGRLKPKPGNTPITISPSTRNSITSFGIPYDF